MEFPKPGNEPSSQAWKLLLLVLVVIFPGLGTAGKLHSFQTDLLAV